jgi:hypothetical protein
MDGHEFYASVVAHKDLIWLGAKTNTQGVDCAYIATRRLGSVTEIPIAAIKDHDWDTWQSLALGLRPAKIMKYITRIVGYYSELHNWNPSKIAELHDRHNGTYSVPESVARAVAAA